MVQHSPSPTTILRRRQVEALSGYSRSTIYLRISEGLWTRPVALGARAVGWPAAEVEALNAARISGKSDADIRALVMKLEEARGGWRPVERKVGHSGKGKARTSKRAPSAAAQASVQAR